MSTLAIQCGWCRFKSWLGFDPSDLEAVPHRVCEVYPEGVPVFVSTIDPGEQKDCSKFEEK
jgi:hypothetical protein